MPDLPWEPQNSHILYGYARSITSGATITATNKSTGETQTVQTEEMGVFLIDCANFSTSGYSDRDNIELEVNNNRVRTSVNITQFPAGRRIDIVQTKQFGHTHNRFI